MSRVNEWYVYRGDFCGSKRNDLLENENVHIFTQHWITENSTSKTCFHLRRGQIETGEGAFPMEGIEVIKGDIADNLEESSKQVEIQIIRRFR